MGVGLEQDIVVRKQCQVVIRLSERRKVFFTILLFRPPFFLTKECGPVELSIKDVYMANDDQSNQRAQPAQFSC